MELLLVLLLLAGPLDARPAVTREATLTLKELAQWKVAEYEQNPFRGMSVEQFSQMYLSRALPNKRARPSGPLIQATGTFDPRISRSQCLRGISNQGQCESSWAISTADALSDRFCVALGPASSRVFSAQYMLTCDTNNYGCGGGYVSRAWSFAEKVGLVNENCVANAGNSYKDGKSCPTRCSNGEPLSFHKCMEGSVREFSYYTEDIMTELREKGSLSMSMVVYDDFLYYKGGIYRHTMGTNDLGRHAVRCTGYGIEQGVSYWLCANSWGPTWGEQGWFKVAFGEADIEGDVWGCVPDFRVNQQYSM